MPFPGDNAILKRVDDRRPTARIRERGIHAVPLTLDKGNQAMNGRIIGDYFTLVADIDLSFLEGWGDPRNPFAPSTPFEGFPLPRSVE